MDISIGLKELSGLMRNKIFQRITCRLRSNVQQIKIYNENIK